MPSYVSFVSIDSPVSVGYSVSYVYLDAGAIASGNERAVSQAYMDAGTGAFDKPLGDVSVTNSSSSIFSSTLAAVVVTPGSNIGFVSYAEVSGPVTPPLIYDFPIEEGVDFTSSSSSQLASSLAIVVDTGDTVPFSIGPASFTSQSNTTLSGTVTRRLTPSRTKVIYG